MTNVQHPTQWASIHSRYAQQNGSDNSDVTYPLREPITVPDSNVACLLSIQHFTFYNSFANISAGNNKLKVLSTFYESGTFVGDITEVSIPVGHYDINGLLAYLNTDGVCNRIESTYYYGLGVNGDTAYPPFAISDSDALKLVIQPPTAGTTGVLSSMAAAHEYSGFYLIVDSDTEGAMETLGFYNKNDNNFLTNVKNVKVGTITYKCAGFDVYNGGVATDYSFTSPWAAPSTLLTTSRTSINNLFLAGPMSLALNIENIYANTRNSFENLSRGNTVAIAPVVVAYGYKQVYQPPVLNQIKVTGLEINTLRITILDTGTGKPVNFQGSQWEMNIRFEFVAIENNARGSMAEQGYHQTVHPIMHHTLHDHNMPHSGTNGHTETASGKVRKRSRALA